MNSAARVLASVVLGLCCVGSVACSAPSIPTTDYDLGWSTTKSKTPKDDVEDEASEPAPAPKQQRSDAPAPAPTSSSDPAPPSPPPDSAPTVDPAACTNLGTCCQKIENTIGRISCLAVQAKGDLATCLKSLIACEASTGLGGSSGSSGSSGARCYDDYDCPGVQLCYSDGICR